MPRNKKISVLTIAPAHTQEAIDEITTGIEDFIEWANRARTGATQLSAALEADKALTSFSQGRFSERFTGLSVQAVAAGMNIRNFVREGHWHLRLCPLCNQWLLAKDQRRALCRRIECVRARKATKRAEQRKLQRELDDAKVKAARR